MTEHAGSAFDPASYLKSLTHRPGVYRMLGDQDEVLYVGKAKDLRRRVGSYFSRSSNRRIQTMVGLIRDIHVTVTHTEAEALLLENNLIKALKPRFNVLLRDDKSYPYIYLSDDEFPRLTFHRGAKRRGGRYFGPYPSAGAVRSTLQQLQKLFPVRQCDNSYYSNRSRPCLQYQIKRCTAPCVGLVSRAEYAGDVKDSEWFLEGRAADVIDRLGERMDRAALQLEYEQAARYRDQIEDLRRVQDKQYITGERGDLDLLACELGGGLACVQLFFVRQGRNLGNKVFFPKIADSVTIEEVISAFVAQHYLGGEAPAEILVSHRPEDKQLLAEALSAQAGRRVRIVAGPRGDRARWLQLARENARIALHARLASSATARARIEALQQLFNLDDVPQRLECFDISHTAGDQTVASCVVFDAEGPRKADYRRFNIKEITPGDDYGALRQALTRRYTRIQAGDGVLPDLLFIDGGKGQLTVAGEVLEELAVYGVLLIGVAKGPDRRPGMEQLILVDRPMPLILPAQSPALHLIQQIRDEAHRFAITGHRQRRSAAKTRSVLEDIPGIGPKRRQRLLKAFGGLQGLARAGIEDLTSVEGVSQNLARQIYQVFHGSE
jgi:excinuclease ABC subunit C